MKGFTLKLFSLLLSLSVGTSTVWATSHSDPAKTQREKTASNAIEFRVQGNVTDADGTALIGVNIVEKDNPTNGTITDLDGNFQLTVADQNSVIIFSYAGYRQQEVALNGRSQLEVSMEAGALLDEVVVVGYGTQVKRDLTGAVSTIKAKDLQAFNASSLDQQMQGLATGVQVTSSAGVPGAPVRVMVRGTNSLFSGTEPLWIIDGMILSGQGGGELNGFSRNASTTPFNPLASLNPNDIESIEVLKDAAATSVYGSRGANGVIIVTTKTGQQGRGTLDLSVNYGVTDVVRGPEEIGYVDGPTWLQLTDEARANRNFAPFDPNSLLDDSRDPTAVLSRDQLGNVNYFDEVLRQGQITDINLSASRGMEKLNYYLSANYREDESILVGDRQERYSVRANVDFEPAKNLSVGTRVNLSYVNRERAPNGGAPGGNANIARGGYNMTLSGALPIIPLFHPTLKGTDGQPLLFDPLSGRNVLATLNRDNYINDVETYRALAGLQVEYSIPWVKGLSIRSELAADIIQTSNIEWGNTVIREDSKYGFDNSSTFQRLNYNLFGIYNRKFGQRHDLNVVFGTESTEQAQRTRNIEAQQLFGAAQELGAPGDVQRVSTGFGGERYFRGYFGRLNYKLDNRYLLGLSYRYDGSSVFTEDLRWGNFAAVSAGWVLTEESFLENMELINFLKLRASFGQTGNSSISPTATETTYTGWGRYGDVGAGDLLTGIGNSAVTWETTDAVDVGVDFEILEGRINGSIGYYQQDVKDMLFQVPVPVSAGVFNSGPRIWQNVGDMQNSGWEFEFNSVNVNSRAFKWNMSFNITTNQNQITKLVGESDEIANVNSNGLVSKVGEKIGFFRLARYAGIHPEGGYELIEEMDLEQFAATGERIPTGNLIPATRANLQQHLFDNMDKSGLPTFFGGFNNTFTFKGLDISALISFSGGNYIYDLHERSTSYVTGGMVRQSVVGNYWTPGNTSADLPALSADRRYDVINEDGSISANQRFDNRRAGQVHDKFLHRGDFIRMRALTVGYTLPQSIAQNLSMQNIRVSFVANNLFTFTGYEGFDPEVVNLGGSSSRNLGQGWIGVTLPQVKSYNFNLNISF